MPLQKDQQDWMHFSSTDEKSVCSHPGYVSFKILLGAIFSICIQLYFAFADLLHRKWRMCTTG